MNARPHMPPYHTNALAIRQEIQRFESVHPSIYAIYDLIELVADPSLAQQIRDHVVCIEDSFVNSQEWTLSRSVPDLRLGIVGSLSSGKSALVHRYLTGTYMQEESPEGGRFKKEIVVDAQSYLLLIRDEGGPPELQFTSWVDAVIFVFSLENESSFNAIYNYYTKMSHFRSTSDIPLILVGTQDAISENNPRVIDDARARKLANDLKRCSYYETCATYGLNVERVFQDACNKIVQQRLNSLTPTNSRPSTPNHFPTAPRHHPVSTGYIPSPTNNGFNSHTSNTSASPASNVQSASPSHAPHNVLQPVNAGIHKDFVGPGKSIHGLGGVGSTHESGPKADEGPAPPKWMMPPSQPPPSDGRFAPPTNNEPKIPSQAFDSLQPPQKDQKDLPTPSSTPTTSRKSRRRSNLFTPSKKGDDKLKNGELGSGRAIPLKQGYLYKRSSKALNKDWKKKYVTLCDDGRLTYHPSLHDYMDDVHGKEISLQYVTVKVPGQKPRGSKSVLSTTTTNGLLESIGGLSLSGIHGKDKKASDKVFLTSYEALKEPGIRMGFAPNNCDDNVIGNVTSQVNINGTDSKIETPNVKKRHRRIKSSGMKNTECDDSDGYEFFIVSLDNKQWHFEATNADERDDWVTAIEQQILNSLQGNESSKSKSRLNSFVDAASVQSIKSNIPGNAYCVDCDAPNPDWASLNLGVLMCIECSGIHRNLGSHISKVRSLDLDDWPPGHLCVMLSLGNKMANSVWEAHIRGRAKPTPNSSREEKERWIRAKYESKEFIAPVSGVTPIVQQLVDALCRSDMKCISHLLAHATVDQVNATVGPRDLRTPLHLACALDNLAAVQLLLWHNANVKAIDHEGRTCLAYVQSGISGSRNSSHSASAASSIVELLIQNGCPEITSGTLPRRRGSLGHRTEVFDKLPSSVI